MNNRNVFSFICQKDIEDIYNKIKPYLPDFDLSSLNQSIIYDDYKKIVCRAIKNSNKEIVGKEIVIHLYDTNEIYKLKHLENSIKLERIDKNIKEKTKIILYNYIITRFFMYNDGDNVSTAEEEYNLYLKDSIYSYVNCNSIEDSLNHLKNKNKTRKRT